MKAKDLLGDSYTIPVETNQVIKAMLNKVSKELFYDQNYSQGYKHVTREGIPLGNKVNEVFFLQQGEQSSMFEPLENNIVGSISNGSQNIQATCIINEHEIKRAVRNDLDLQDIYIRMLENLRTSLLKERRKLFLKELTNYLNNNDVRLYKTFKLSEMGSVVKAGFQVPLTTYNVQGKEVQSLESDIVTLIDYRKLGAILNEPETPFTSWLQWNCIIEDTLPANVNQVLVNPDMIIFDKRTMKILVNDKQFSYFFDPNTLTYTVTYTENVIIASNTLSNICVIKDEQRRL